MSSKKAKGQDKQKNYRETARQTDKSTDTQITIQDYMIIQSDNNFFFL